MSDDFFAYCKQCKNPNPTCKCKSSDQDLRDKLASEAIVSEFTGQLMAHWHVADFKAGRNAARANVTDREQAQLKTELAKIVTERDQLRAEVNSLRQTNSHLKSKVNELGEISRGTTFAIANAKYWQKYAEKERDKLRAEVERLKEFEGNFRIAAELQDAAVKDFNVAQKKIVELQKLHAIHSDVVAERDQLKAMCEKLANVLQDHIDWSNKYADGTQHDTEMEQVLAEYQKLEKK